MVKLLQEKGSVHQKLTMHAEESVSLTPAPS